MARKLKRSSSSAASASRSGQSSRQRGHQIHAKPLYHDLLGIAGSLLRSRQESGAAKINTLAGAARSISHDLQDVPHVQAYVSATADQIDILADYVAKTSLEQMVEDGTAMARRHPISALVFTVTAGFWLIRLMERQNLGGIKNQTARRQAVRSAGKKTTKRAKVNGSDRSHENATAA